MIGSAGITAGAGAIPRLLLGQSLSSDKGIDTLEGFIVSDAHFGWKHKQQPAPDEQREAMRRIMQRFSKLDVFVDTGDAHHGGANDAARGLWTDIIAGGCGELPFHYVAGNHEIIPTCGLDPEWRCNVLGSVSCRPYYSFDIKGIHFVSLPEMKRAVFLTRETMEWLALDLEVNREKTVLILSHNNILGTTTPLGEYGYRGLANSQEVLALLKRYPNVIGWLNGHNHTYEVMAKDNILFVSNGRIGGFVPPPNWGKVGQGHLGGVYFKVSKDGLAVRSYSATAEKFMDEMGDEHLSGCIRTQTSLNAASKPAYSYGFGGMCDGQRIPVVHHHAAGKGKTELFMCGADDASFNDDPDFALYQLRKHDTLGPHHQLMNASIQLNERWGEMWVENEVYEWLDPGVRFVTRKSTEDVTRMSIPLIDHGKASCYRCVPGRKYRATLDLESDKGGQTLRLTFVIHDRNQREIAEVPGPVWELRKGRRKKRAMVSMPSLSKLNCIYNNPDSDNTVHLMVMAEFSNMTNQVDLHRFELALADADGPTRDPVIMVDGQRYGHKGELKPEDVIKVRMRPHSAGRTVCQAGAMGNRRITWLIRETAPDWQVRNAPVADMGDHLVVGPMRNAYSEYPEIVIVPMTPNGKAYVHRLRGVDKARVFPLNRGNCTLKVKVAEAAGECEIEVVSAVKPNKVSGTDTWEYKAGRALLKAKEGSVLELDFS